MDNYLLQASVLCFENDNDAFIPERWANEGLALLSENMVMAQLVHRDFSMELANFGDVVNTRRPQPFQTRRKVDADSIDLQDASATNVPVTLNQHIYISFTIKDGEASKSFQDLIQIYIAPGMEGVARTIDRALCGQVHKYLANKVGKLGALSSTTAKQYLLDARQVLNQNLAYPQGRRCVLSSSAESSMLATDLFLKANERGDGGFALTEAALGRVLGFDTYMDQNQPEITSGADTLTGAVNGAVAAGVDTVVAAAAITGAVNGDFVTIAGDAQPRYIKTTADTITLVLDGALKYAVANADAIVVYQHCDADGAHAAGYSKGITLDGYTATKVPQVGQLLAFGETASTRHTYTIIEAYENPSNASQTIVWLDRPLEKAIVDNENAFPGPYGSFNLAFHRDALALVTRPLALPRAGGVQSAVANYNDVAMRVTMQYDITTQGTIVTMDLLAGIAVLDTDLGCVILG
ncbi:hypothetical protein M0R72_15485 [Candidatus Pacearchaeota archaeon]|jgi:hypothetical protein|nr:hypothetical protein [Candidatus Pacearchaeota archaeon]